MYLTGAKKKKKEKEKYSTVVTTLSTSANLFSATRDHKGLFENFKGMTHPEDLKSDPTLCREGILMEAVEKFI